MCASHVDLCFGTETPGIAVSFHSGRALTPKSAEIQPKGHCPRKAYDFPLDAKEQIGNKLFQQGTDRQFTGLERFPQAIHSFSTASAGKGDRIMIALGVIALFTATTCVVLTVIAASLHRACTVYAELQRALAHCDMQQPVVFRVKVPEARPAPVAKLRPALPPTPAARRVSRQVAAQPARRVAA